MTLSPEHTCAPAHPIAVERVLQALLDEAMDLMDEATAVVAFERRKYGLDPVAQGMALRFAARLSRVAGWIVVEIGHKPAQAHERAQLAKAVQQAARGPLETNIACTRISPSLRLVVGKIDRLVDRALRIQAMIAGDSAATVACEDEIAQMELPMGNKSGMEAPAMAAFSSDLSARPWAETATKTGVVVSLFPSSC
ncbi:MAG: hypothetical protein MRY63_02815 [Neomegalonema sp.]|nr:hypothetical protein [Neomegalonema sp.]